MGFWTTLEESASKPASVPNLLSSFSLSTQDCSYGSIWPSRAEWQRRDYSSRQQLEKDSSRAQGYDSSDRDVKAAAGSWLMDGIDQLQLAYKKSEQEKAHSTLLQVRLHCKECEHEVNGNVYLPWRKKCGWGDLWVR